MLISRSAQSIGRLLKEVHPFATDTLAPSRFLFLGEFTHIRNVIETFFLAEEMPCGAVALGIPAFSQKGKLVINFPVFVPDKLAVDDKFAKPYEERSKQGTLEFDPLACALGAVMKCFQDVKAFANTTLGRRLKRLISMSGRKSWVEIEDPQEVFGRAFKRSFDAKVKYHIVRPLVLDGKHIFGAFGIDLKDTPDVKQLKRLLVLLEAFQHNLSGLYGSYYSHLDEPPKRIANRDR